MRALYLIFLVIMLPICHGFEISYDANGNVVYDDEFYREYNVFNQLSKVYNGTNASAPLLQQYVYDPLEERVAMKITYNNDGSKKETVYYWTENDVTVENSSGVYNYTYVYLDGQLIAQEVNGEKHFIHGDHLGSSSVVTGSDGSVLENTSYSPFGSVLEGGEVSRYDYEGQEFDSVLGEHDFNFRHYKSDWGIFTQPDDRIPSTYDPQSLNHYMFERGNPYKYTDPTGHETIQIGEASNVGAIWGGQSGMGLISATGNDGTFGTSDDEWAMYKYNGGGVTLGATAQLGAEVTGSLGDHVNDVGGWSMNFGLSASFFGIEFNLALSDPSKSSISLSAGAGQGFDVFHGHLVSNTIMFQGNNLQDVMTNAYQSIGTVVRTFYSGKESLNRASKYLKVLQKRGCKDCTIKDAKRKMAKRDLHKTKKSAESSSSTSSSS